MSLPSFGQINKMKAFSYQENVEHSVHKGDQFKKSFPYLNFSEPVGEMFGVHVNQL